MSLAPGGEEGDEEAHWYGRRAGESAEPRFLRCRPRSCGNSSRLEPRVLRCRPRSCGNSSRLVRRMSRSERCYAGIVLEFVIALPFAPGVEALCHDRTPVRSIWKITMIRTNMIIPKIVPKKTLIKISSATARLRPLRVSSPRRVCWCVLPLDFDDSFAVSSSYLDGGGLGISPMPWSA
jgi:hypothetical protein